MIAPNCAESVILWLGTMAAGGIWTSVNPKYAAVEQHSLVERFSPTLLVVDGKSVGSEVTDAAPAAAVVPVSAGAGLAALLTGSSGAAPAPPEIDPNAPAAVGFTSGTSGRPRGVLHSQAGLLLAAEANLQIPKPSGALGVVLSTMVLNIMVLGPLQGLLAGRTVVLANRTDGEYLARWCVEHAIAEIGVPPAIVHDLLEQSDRLRDGRVMPQRVETGGAACNSDLQSRFHSVTGRRLIRCYGLTEAPGTVAMSRAEDPFSAESSGRAMPHVTVTIRGEDGQTLPAGVQGEICVSAATDGPLVGRYLPMSGYLDGADPVPVHDGVLHTGDLGRLDADGRLFVTGRTSALIIRGGANISPAEVEDVLVSHPAVDDAAVFGVPDERLGEVVAAVIVVADDCTAPSAEELRVHAERFLARYKLPKHVIVVPEIPRNATGKPDRSGLLSAVDRAIP